MGNYEEGMAAFIYISAFLTLNEGSIDQGGNEETAERDFKKEEEEDLRETEKMEA